jgi:hypothetical protein
MMNRLSWILFFCASFLISNNVCAQLRHIDSTKLPQDERVQKAYSSLLPIEHFAHSWSQSWEYDTPKQQVVSLLTSSLHDLKLAEASAPQNEELFLLEGFVAHLAYNVDVEETYETAVQSLEKAHKLAPTDYRAKWFLGAHRCQSDELKEGMEQLLAVEARVAWQQLPIDFWDDYMNCSMISLMPAHTLRAVDHAEHLGESPSSNSTVVNRAHNSYKSTDAITTYPAHEAWRSKKENGNVQFSSELCGIGFSSHGDWKLELSDVAKGVCSFQIETGPYPGKTGGCYPNLLVVTRIPKPQETLDDFVRSALKAPSYNSAKPTTAPFCPSDKCLAFDVVTKAMYQSEGGAHLLIIAFASQAPDFPGLLFEEPRTLPKTKSDGQIHYYIADERLHRLPGTLYTLVMLDSTSSVFEKAKDDFIYLLKSIRLD